MSSSAREVVESPPPSPSKRPGLLLHIGYGRAGSTILRDWFTAHPQLIFEVKGIWGVTHSEDLPRLGVEAPTPPRWYVTSEETLAFWRQDYDPVGHRVPHYDVDSHRNSLADALSVVAPGGTVLIITRGFSEIMRSSHAIQTRYGCSFTYEEFLEDYGPMFTEIFNYDRQVEVYEERFGKDNVIVLPYEMLAQHPDAFLAVLSEKLEIEHLPLPDGRPSQSWSSERVHDLAQLNALVERLVTGLSDERRTRLYGSYVRRVGDGGLSRLAHLVGRRRPPEDCRPPTELLTALARRAAVLCSRPEYEPFASSYGHTR